MSQIPLISVVIPTYNHARLLRKALESVCCQTFRNWEAIVVNNYSEDDTEAVVASFADPRISLENFRNNGVIAASRNLGIRQARGKYVAFLDSDDSWHPEKLERVKTMLDQDCDLVCHGEIWMSNGVELRRVCYGPATKSDYRSLLFERNCISTSAAAVKKDCLTMVGGFSEEPEFVMVEDYDLWLKLARAGCRFSFIDDMLGVFNLHEANSSRAVYRQMRSELALLNKHFSEIGEWTLGDRLRRLRRIGRVYLAYGARGLR
ncbi:MAG: glycosyltransferase family A protein [Pseudomonadota bacterium]